jgi:hypothetical protein
MADTGKTLTMTMTDAAENFRVRMHRQWASGQRLGGTPLWLGPPGSAKTALQQSIARDVGASLGAKVLVFTVTLADIEVVDVKGMALPAKNPETNQLDRIVYTRSGILPTPEQEEDYDFIFLQVDEVPAATLDHAKVINQLLLDYRLGSVHLPPSKYFVAATGNDVSHKSGAIRLPAHTINRVELTHIEPDARPWLVWAARDDSYVHPLARAFVEMRPMLFLADNIPAEPNKSFATLRSFTLGIEALMARYSTQPYDKPMDRSDPSAITSAFDPENAPIATVLLSSYIGEGAAVEFMQFGRVREHLVPLKEILDDPEGARVPDDVGAGFAQASYLVAWTTPKNAEKLITYVLRMRRDMRMGTILAMQKKPDCRAAVVNCKAYVEFAVQNSGLVQTTIAAAR